MRAPPAPPAQYEPTGHSVGAPPTQWKPGGAGHREAVAEAVAVAVLPPELLPVLVALPVPAGATGCVPVVQAVAVALPVVVAVALPVADAVAVGEAVLLPLDAPIPLSVIFPKLKLAVPVVSETES